MYNLPISAQLILNLPVTCGVPQGSILGPLLFLIYMNDIYRSSPLLKFILFADDTTLLFSAKTLLELTTVVNHELQNVSEWFRVNRLSLNISKTNFIIFKKASSLATPVNLKFDNVTIKQVSTLRYLGLEIDNQLSWKDHIKKIENKIAVVTGIIRKIRFKLSTKTSLLIYDSLISSQLYYCNILWASTYKSSLAKIISLQKRALRACLGKPNSRFKPNQPIPAPLVQKPSVFQSCNKLTVSNIFKLQVAKFVFQVLHKISPVQFSPLFRFNSVLYNTNTRSENKLFQPYARTNFRKFSISVTGPNIWNSLPQDLRSIQSYTVFVKRIKKYLASSSG